MPYSSYNYLINHINFAMARDTNKAKLRVNNKLMPLLGLLHHLGAVETYLLFSETNARGRVDRYAIVTLTFFRTKPFLRNLKVCSKPSKHYTVSYRALKLASRQLGFSTMILSTSRGLLSHRDALRLRQGGLLTAMVE